MSYDDAARARIARGWLSAPCDQTSYAAQHGISTRALRDWVARFCASERPEVRARNIIVSAMEDLQRLLDALDAGAACRSGTAACPDADAAPDASERHAVPERPTDQPSSTPIGASAVLVPLSMPRGGYWG
jgi:hypothetical protein